MENHSQTYFPEKLKIKYKAFQREFLKTWKRFPAFVAAWGTGKTMFAIMRGITLSKEYPNNLGLICRKEFVDLRDSTMKDFELYTDTPINKETKEVRFANGSVIMFRHADELSKLKNINLGWFFVEQGEEFETSDQWFFLNGRLRRANVPFRTGFLIANTNGHNWIWNLWKNNPPNDQYPLWEATTFDNSDVLPQDFLDSLKDIKKTRPKIYNRYVLNSWEDVDTVDNVIQHEWVMRATKTRLPRVPNKRIVVCDPARYGDDETVIYGMIGTEIKESEIYQKKSTMETAGRLLLMRDKVRANMIAVDSGMGGGICDRIKELAQKDIAKGKLRVFEINAGSKSEKVDKFKNLKSQMWWEAGEDFQNDVPCIPNDPVLHEQLTLPRYKVFSDKTIQVETKEEIRKRLGGSSPDRADALIMGLYAIKKAQPVVLTETVAYPVPEAVKSGGIKW